MNPILHYRGKAAAFFARWRWRCSVAAYKIRTAWRDRGDLRSRLIGEDVVRYRALSVYPIGPTTIRTVDQVIISEGLFGWIDTGIIRASTVGFDTTLETFIYLGHVFDTLEAALERFHASTRKG